MLNVSHIRARAREMAARQCLTPMEAIVFEQGTLFGALVIVVGEASAEETFIEAVGVTGGPVPSVNEMMAQAGMPAKIAE